MAHCIELHYFEFASFSNQPTPDVYGSYAIIDGVRRPIGVGEKESQRMRRQCDSFSDSLRHHRVQHYVEAT